MFFLARNSAFYSNGIIEFVLDKTGEKLIELVVNKSADKENRDERADEKLIERIRESSSSECN